ncbi:ABC transporter permease [Croceicoccus mobilis]|uniref:ABC transporter permease n=1 Tax=Croceicoccus mobilis TaxID=1703339 RepID=A0A917DU95_9SPHN|nr:ABC transporter permease [Croceicoccus mobilis]GGD69436.1 ABC transporter permease [Croceicoccus mobilis]
MGGALKATIIKEFWALLRDPKGRITLVLPPMIQLVIFSFAVTLDVNNVDVAVLDRSGGSASIELIQQIEASPSFDEVKLLHSMEEVRRAVETQDVIAALVIEQDFDRDIVRGQPASVGVILDGRKSNAAQIVGGYLTRIAASTGAVVSGSPLASREASAPINWFNPNLEYIWFNMPSLLVIIVSVAGLSVTAQSVAREREMGTFDQLMVSPLTVPQILIGKMIPPFCVGLFNGTVYLIVAPLVFGVPFTGSLALFYLGLSAYLLSLIGVGLFVSSLSMTQQQAFLGSFVATVPVILLSGFSSPVENMPGWLQFITYGNPARYFLELSLGQFLKDMPAADVFGLLWPLLLIATITISAAGWLFRARME